MDDRNLQSDDSLESILKRAADNQLLMPKFQAQLFEFVSDIHKEIIAATKEPVLCEEVPMLLVMQAHHYFLGAVRLACGGMMAPTFPLLRAALESVAYAMLAEGSHERALQWLKRDKNPQTLKDFRKTFTFARAVSHLSNLDPDLADYYVYLYDVSIKHGAHPNVAGTTGSVLATTNGTGETDLTMRMIHHVLYDPVVDTFDAVVHMGAAVGAGIRYALPKHVAAKSAYDRFLKISNDMASFHKLHMAARGTSTPQTNWQNWAGEHENCGATTELRSKKKRPTER